MLADSGIVAAARSRLWSEQDAGVRDAEARAAQADVMALAETIPDGARRAAFFASPEVRPWLGPGGRRRTTDAPGADGLTGREREVAAAVARGLSTKEIAAALGVAE